MPVRPTQTKGGAFYRNADWCIVCKAIEEKDFDITKVPEDQLPDELKKMKPEERVNWIKGKIAEREKIQKEIAEMEDLESEMHQEVEKRRDSINSQDSEQR